MNGILCSFGSQVFAKDLTKELHWELLEKIMEVYQNEQPDDKTTGK